MSIKFIVVLAAVGFSIVGVPFTVDQIYDNEFPVIDVVDTDIELGAHMATESIEKLARGL